MAYDQDLADRFRAALGSRWDYYEQRMMGSLCFMIEGHMIGGCHRTKSGDRRFMFRVGKPNQAEALARPGAMPMVHGGRRMGGFVYVEASACDPAALVGWIELAAGYVATLPPK
jgi:hypothetical protein